MLATPAQPGIDAFFASLARAPHRVLFLDYDGTLAPFRLRPENALPYPGVPMALRQLARRTETRIVIVSGRRLEDLRAPLAALPHDEAWGAHGWQRSVAGAEVDIAPPPEAQRDLDHAEEAAQLRRLPGARVERKIASVAVHWRGMEARAATTFESRVFDAWQALGSGHLDFLAFDEGMELRVRGRHKGRAVAEVLSGYGGAPVACAYLGDDLTDEDAFAEVAGRGLGVLVRPRWRATRAQAWVRPPHGVLEFLRRWSVAGRD